MNLTSEGAAIWEDDGSQEKVRNNFLNRKKAVYDTPKYNDKRSVI